MGSFLTTSPDFADHELLFDETETRQILKFFWPHATSGIMRMHITVGAKRLAQEALIVAIDASFAMGFIEQTVRTLANPGKSVRSLAQKLAQRYVQHWWKHATPGDLQKARIYETIRRDISWQMRTAFDACLNGIAMRRSPKHYAASAKSSLQAWV